MNFIVLCDKRRKQEFEGIVNKTPNCNFIGGDVVIRDDFLVHIYNDYNPHGVIIEAGVRLDCKKTLPQIACSIKAYRPSTRVIYIYGNIVDNDDFDATRKTLADKNIFDIVTSQDVAEAVPQLIAAPLTAQELELTLTGKEKNSEADGVLPDRKGWYWKSKSLGGANAIDYLQKVHNLSFADAIAELINQPAAVTSIEYKTNPEKPNVSRDFSLPEKTEGKYPRAYSYLTKSRFIAPEIVNSLMHEKKIYQDWRGNVVFVGFDKENNAKYAAIRTTLSDVRFRGEVGCSDKQYGFTIDGVEKDRIYFFEAAIDAMSHATLANLVLGDKDAWKQHSRLALGCTADVALEHYLNEHPEVKSIILCLDNDAGGYKAVKIITEKYSEKGYTVRNRPPKLKDFNEDLAFYVCGNKALTNQNENTKAAASAITR